jgi:hypothetical protein
VKPNYDKMVKLFEQHPDRAPVIIREAFEQKELRPRDFDFGRLFEACFGWHNFRSCRHENAMAHDIMEAQGATSTAAFQSISGQIVYNTIMEKYMSEEFTFTQLIPTVQTQLSGEKIAGISQLGDEATVVPEGDPFPLVGVREDYIETPETKKRGFIAPVTREAVFFDRTGVLLDRLGEGSYFLGLNKEKRAIDCIIDENTTDHRYRWRGVTIASYGDNTGTHTWDNLVASNAFVDWTDIDNAEQTANALVDPNTGEPIMFDYVDIVATKQLERAVARNLSATEIRVTTPGFATSANPTQTQAANPYLNRFTYRGSRLLAARLATDTDWFIGNIGKYARYMQNWPISTRQAPTNSHDEFHRDIVMQWRCDERGAFVVVEPRAVVKNTA